jgi:hypothetical protein
MITPQQFNQLLPLAASWAEQQEKHILQNGAQLTASQLVDAKLVQVDSPEKVKLLKVDQIPLPNEVSLKSAAQMLGLITANTIGLTLRYGVFIRKDFWNDRKIVVHELVHVAQYERLGNIANFLQRYLQECITIGYPQAPMEQEAITLSNKIVLASNF